MKHVGVLGCGTMGNAIARSLQVPTVVYDLSEAATAALASYEHISVASTLAELLQRCDTILLAVKPQTLPALYDELASYKRTWVSIAAGISLAELTRSLNSENVVRLMPNIGASVQQSVTALAAAPHCSPDAIEAATALAKSFGVVVPIAESLFSAFIGISGSAIAYMLLFIHALTEGGVAEGIPAAVASEIVTETLQSAIALLKAGQESPEALAASVCSEGGTTIEGVRVLEADNFHETVLKAVHAASDKSKRMEAQRRTHTENEEEDD